MKHARLLSAAILALSLLFAPQATPTNAAPVPQGGTEPIVITPITNLWRVTGESHGKKVGVLCNVGYLFEKSGRVYGFTSQGCGTKGELYAFGTGDDLQHVGRIVGKDILPTSFMRVVQFDRNVVLGPSPKPLPAGVQARPLVNTVVYRVADTTWLKTPLLLTGVRDDRYGVSSFDFLCDTKKVIPGSVVLANNYRGPFLGIYTGYHKLSQGRLGICYAVANSYLEDLANTGQWTPVK